MFVALVSGSRLQVLKKIGRWYAVMNRMTTAMKRQTTMNKADQVMTKITVAAVPVPEKHTIPIANKNAPILVSFNIRKYKGTIATYAHTSIAYGRL